MEKLHGVERKPGMRKVECLSCGEQWFTRLSEGVPERCPYCGNRERDAQMIQEVIEYFYSIEIIHPEHPARNIKETGYHKNDFSALQTLFDRAKQEEGKVLRLLKRRADESWGCIARVYLYRDTGEDTMPLVN